MREIVDDGVHQRSIRIDSGANGLVISDIRPPLERTSKSEAGGPEFLEVILEPHLTVRCPIANIQP